MKKFAYRITLVNICLLKLTIYEFHFPCDFRSLIIGLKFLSREKVSAFVSWRQRLYCFACLSYTSRGGISRLLGKEATKETSIKSVGRNTVMAIIEII